MGAITVVIAAIRGFFAGLLASRKARAGAEIERGKEEVKTSDDNVAAVEGELADKPK